MDIKELVKKAHENATSKGFWEDWELCIVGVQVAIDEGNQEHARLAVLLKANAISSRLMLIVSELAEALEGLRKGDSDNFQEEMADVAIRLADLCGGLDIDLEAEIIKKMDKNKDRPYKHGKAF